MLTPSWDLNFNELDSFELIIRKIYAIIVLTYSITRCHQLVTANYSFRTIILNRFTGSNLKDIPEVYGNLPYYTVSR